MRKIIKIISLVFVLALLLVFLKNYSLANFSLCLSVLDVGQGEASLINLGNRKIILIDGGPDNSILRKLGEELPFYKRGIDFIIISHFHDDHILGLIEIIKRYQVKYLVYADGLEVFPPGDILIELAQEKGVEIVRLKASLTLDLEKNCRLTLLHPHLFVTDNDNDSLISYLNCHGLTFLNLGDNEGKVEVEFVKQALITKVDIFLASHHGSKTSNSKELLELLQPQALVISVGANNRFGHPDLNLLRLAKELNLSIFRTDKQGTISFSR